MNYVFPNIEPTIKAVEELGFVQISQSIGRIVFEKQGLPGQLAILWETACWDVSDSTWLEYSVDGKFTSNHMQGRLNLFGEDGTYFYMGCRNVPTAAMIRAAIIHYVEFTKKRAKEKLLAAVTELEEAHIAYNKINFELKW